MSKRRLHDAAAPRVAVVATADELQDAIVAGEKNIQIRRHLDLRPGAATAPPTAFDANAPLPPVLGFIPPTVRTIRGNCTQPPPLDLLPADPDDAAGELPMLPLRRNQCLLLTDTALLISDARLWLDGLYVRTRRETDSLVFVVGALPVMSIPSDRRGLWMTDVSIQGDSGPHFGQNRGLAVGVQVGEANFYAQDCTFANLGGEGPVSAVDVVAAKADLVDCAFRDNYMGGPAEGVVQGINNASIALHRPSFSGNSGDGHLLHFDPHQEGAPGWAEGVDNRVKVFSDDPALVDYCQNLDGLQPMQPLAMSDTNLTLMQSWLWRKITELGAIERPLPAVAVTFVEEPNDMGCCNVDCFYADDPAPSPLAFPAGAPRQTPLPAPIAEVPSPGQRQASRPAGSPEARPVLTQQPRGVSAGAAGAAPERAAPADSSNFGALPTERGLAAGAPAPQADDGGAAGSIVAIGLGVVLAVLLTLLATFTWWRWRRGGAFGAAGGRKAADDVQLVAAAPAAQHSRAGTSAFVPRGDALLMRRQSSTLSQGQTDPDVADSRAGLQPDGGPEADVDGRDPIAQMKAMFHQTTDLGTFAESDAWKTPPVSSCKSGAMAARPVQGAPVKQRLAYIGRQLDAFGRRGVILERYEMLGGDDRCQGGQAVVQFVRAPQNNHLYAIKLFASRAAYDDEKHLYLHYFPNFMPTVVQFCDNDDGKFRDPKGGPMPPCFVMEKGESLTERTMCRKSDIFTVIQIIGQVASCLAQLHGQGWVHRDLKPGNIMFLPRTGSWTLIDFGLAARAGEDASVGLTPAYAAPEIIAAHVAGDGSVTADTGVDAWALGVIAFELLTRRPAFDALSAPGAVERQLLGEEPLPWEGERLTPDTKRRLGAIKTPVLRMLCRNPTQRASCKDLATSLRAVFSDAVTTVEHGA